MTQVLWSKSEVLKATNGVAFGGGDWEALRLSMDSREVEKGDLFIALVPDTEGDKYRTSGQDGHNFVQSAYDNGAVAAIVSRKIDCDIPQILVKDTFRALQDLGQFARHRAPLKKVIAVTGSVGKTGVRDMMETAFRGLGFKTHASIKSYNNAIGVPYTLSTMCGSSEVGVFEMGMNYPDEITPLSKQVHPDIAVITWVADVHIQNFDNGIDGIVNAKSEIFNGLSLDGIAILPRDNDYYGDLVKNAETAGVKNIVSFGEHNDADARLLSLELTSAGSNIRASIMGEDISYHLKISGKHIALNSLSVLLAVKLSQGDVQKAASALGDLEPLAGRGRRELIKPNHFSEAFTLVDESYNASPVATIAAFNVLAKINPKNNGRRIAVLGDMRELGDNSVAYHEGLLQPLLDSDIDKVFCCGPFMKFLFDKIPEKNRGIYAQNSDGLAKVIANHIQANDVVLVKGSLGSKMSVIIEALRKMSAQ